MIAEKKILQITGLGEDIPVVFQKEAELAQGEVQGLEVSCGMAPNFGIPYHVDSPLVKYMSPTMLFDSRTEYGENGLALIRDVASGKIC